MITLINHYSHQHTYSITHPINIPNQHTHSITHPIKQPNQHNYSITHPINIPNQHTIVVHSSGELLAASVAGASASGGGIGSIFGFGRR